MPPSSSQTRPLSALFVLLALAAAFVIPPLALADTTYVYTGQPYNPNPPSGCAGTYSPVCSSIGVSGSITFANPLGDNLVGDIVTTESFSFSGGTDAFILTQSSSVQEFFQFWTDANGNITFWGIQAANNSGANAGCLSGASFTCLGSTFKPDGMFTGDYSAYDFNFGTPNEVFGGGTNAVAGSWSLVATPEPSSIFLLCSGLIGVLSIKRG